MTALEVRICRMNPNSFSADYLEEVRATHESKRSSEGYRSLTVAARLYWRGEGLTLLNHQWGWLRKRPLLPRCVHS